MKENDKYCPPDQAENFSRMDCNVFSHFWLKLPTTGYKLIDNREACRIKGTEDNTDVIFPAPDCAELGLMLIAEDPIYYSFTSYDAHGGLWETTVDRFDESLPDQHETLYEGTGATEAESKADAVIYMLKNNIHTIDHLNNILKDAEH